MPSGLALSAYYEVASASYMDISYAVIGEEMELEDSLMHILNFFTG